MFLKPIRDYASYSAPLAKEVYDILYRELLLPIIEALKPARENRNALAHGTPNMKLHGLNIVIENPKGTLRHGPKWIQYMSDHYGYIAGTEAIDGDEVDCFVGPNPQSRKMFVVEQVNPETQKFDEYKVMLGYATITQAKEAYMRNYQKGWQGFRHIQEHPIAYFKKWYKETKTLMVQNALGDVLIDALKSGKIQYVNGFFYGQLNVAISKELRAIGATFNKVRKAYYLDPPQIPARIMTAISQGIQLQKGKIQKIQDILTAMEGREIIETNAEPFFGDTLAKIEKQYFISISPITTSADLEIPLPSHYYDHIKEAYSENLNLYIKKFRDEQIIRLRQRVEKNVAAGFRAERLMDDIQTEKSMTRNHARFLAKQETSLMTAAYREIRYSEIGIHEYVWSTSMDERVRPAIGVRGKARANNHRILQGRKFRFDQPPIVDSANGRSCNPGQDFGCRCTAIPYISGGVNLVIPKPEEAIA